MKPKDLPKTDVEDFFVSFFWRMMDWDPAKRPLTVDVSKHPWLTEGAETLSQHLGSAKALTERDLDR